MKRRNSIAKTILSLLIFVTLIPILINAQDIQPKKIIYETDMCADVDDVGGLAILHAMANNDEAEILAVCFNEVNRYGIAAIDAMNTWYGRGDIPVGIYRGNLNNPDGSGYLQSVAKFPHDLDDAGAPSALDVYRQVLAAQPDSSVTIISVGFLNNINDLLIAEPNLVAQKVKELVQMAGVNNDNFNLTRHNLVSASENVIKNWPSPMVISQAGWDIYTGENYQNASEDNPYREAFYKYFGNSFQGRSSWDEMAVLYGVRGLSTYFNDISSGTGSLTNGYVWKMEPGFRSYLSNRYSNSTYEELIKMMMDQLPIGAHFQASEYSGWLPFSADFDASTSVVRGNRTIQNYLWDFGDGATGEGEMVSHAYSSLGEYKVELKTIDNLGESLMATDIIIVSDPVFSPVNYFGNVFNYTRNQEDLWSTRIDSIDLRLYLSNGPRNPEVTMAGFCFVKDSIYNDFKMQIAVASDEDLSQNSLADYSILFGFEDNRNYNKILMKQNAARLENLSNGQTTAIKLISQKGIPDEQFHAVDIDLSGNQLTVMLDDTVFFSATSSRLVKQGKIGFGSVNNAVFFDDISISGNATATKIHEETNVPEKFYLGQNYPNPFNPSTKISFILPETEKVKLELFNTLGQHIKTILDKPMNAGFHEINFNGQDLFSGVYLYRLEASTFQDVKKMIMIK